MNRSGTEVTDNIHELKLEELESVLGGREFSQAEHDAYADVFGKVMDKAQYMSYEEREKYFQDFWDATKKMGDAVNVLPDGAPDLDVASFFKHLI